MKTFAPLVLTCAVALTAGCQTATSPAPASIESPATAVQANANVEALNKLTAVTIDAGTLYKEAANIANNPDLKSELLYLSGKRAKLAGDLQLKVKEVGGVPIERGKATGVGQRAFAQVRSVFADNEKVAATEVLDSEEALLKEMNSVLGNNDVSEDAKTLVREAMPDVESDRDRVKALARKFGANV